MIKRKRGASAIEIIFIATIVSLFSIGVFVGFRDVIGEYSDMAIDEQVKQQDHLGEQISFYEPSNGEYVDIGDEWVDGSFPDMPDNISSIEINKPTLNGNPLNGTNNFYTGDVINVNISVLPSHLTDYSLRWRIKESGAANDPTIAVLRGKDGKSAEITGLKAGTATIEVSATDFSAESQLLFLNILQKVSGLNFSFNGNPLNSGQNIGSYGKGDTFVIDGTVLPYDASDKRMTWSYGGNAAGSECITMTPGSKSVSVKVNRACGTDKVVELIATTYDGEIKESFSFTVRG